MQMNCVMWNAIAVCKFVIPYLPINVQYFELAMTFSWFFIEQNF